MNAKHTPGPWNIGSSDLPVSRMSIHCKGHKDSCHSTVALMVSRGVIGISHDEEFANARLIAAAPDLLSVVANFEVSGPDGDGLVWLFLHGNGTTGKAMFNLGKADTVAAQVALHLEADRRAAIAKATGESQ